MRHRVRKGKLGLKTEHRLSVLRNLCTELFRHGRITSTDVKIKELRRFSEKKENLYQKNVSQIMTKNPISIEKDSLAAKALSLMNEKKITSLCVHDKKNKYKTIGVVHIHTVLKSNTI